MALRRRREAWLNRFAPRQSRWRYLSRFWLHWSGVATARPTV